MERPNEVHTLKKNADRFTGKDYVDTYEKYRPRPPLEIIHQALNYLNKAKAKTVVDLGCGTGISTEVWRSFAQEVFGIEPSKEMIEIGKRKLPDKSNVNYIIGYSDQIPLPNNSVDIVACSQSFHWMEPQSTLQEIHRILKRGGVLVIYDVIWPPSVNVKFEKAYQELFSNIDKLTNRLEEEIAHRWHKKEHTNNVQKSPCFKFSKESYFHKTQKLSKDQFIGIALSQGGLEALLKRGLDAKIIGIPKFIDKIQAISMPVYPSIIYNYRVVFGVK